MSFILRLPVAELVCVAARIMNYSKRYSIVCLFPVLLLLAIPAQAAVTCEPAVGSLVSVEGRIEVQRDQRPDWQAAGLNETLCQGDTVRAAARSRATVQLINQAVLRIDQNTAMRLDKITPNVEERSLLSLVKGAFQSFSRKPRGFEVSTPYLNGSIEGTEFVFRVDGRRINPHRIRGHRGGIECAGQCLGLRW